MQAGWAARLAVIVTAATLLAAACAGAATQPTAPAASGVTAPPQRTALWIEQRGNTQPFDNGGAVTVGGIRVEVFVAPYPPQREGSVDLYFTEQATGAPIDTGTIAVSFDMYMPHGQIRAEAQPMGGGHYLVPYKLVMPGEWRLDMRLSRGSEMATLSFIFKTG